MQSITYLCRLVVLGIPLVAVASIGVAAELPGTNIRFGHLSLEDGLAQSSVYTVLQDDSGYIWLGTEDGLQQYDGYSFRTYRHSADDHNSLSNSYITRLLQGKQGYLWVGTYAGLNRYDFSTGEFTRYAHEHPGFNTAGHNYIWTLAQTADGGIWVGSDDGLERLDHASGKWTVYHAGEGAAAGLASNVIWALHVDAAGTLWIGSQAGLSYLPQGATDIQAFVAPDNPELFEDVSVNALTEDQLGNLWVGLEGALVRVDAARTKVKVLQPGGDNTERNRIRALLVAGNGELWVAAYEAGVYIIEPESGEIRNFRHAAANRDSLASDKIVSLYQDRSGLIWLGNETAGINTYNPATRAFGHYLQQPDNPTSLSNNTVWSFAADTDNSIWVGTENGLNHMDLTTGQFTHYRHNAKKSDSLGYDFIGALYRDTVGTLWVGTLDGLDRYLGNGRFEHVDFLPRTDETIRARNISLLREDSQGRFWVATGGGLFLLDRNTRQYTWYRQSADNSNSLPSELVVAMVERPDGRFWIGTDGGLSLFNPSTGEFFNHTSANASKLTLPNDFVHSLYLAPDGVLWVGTSGGLLAYDETHGNSRVYTTEDGLPNNTVYCILPDNNGDLWLSTNNGLVHFNPQRNFFAVYGPADGLQSREFNTASCLATPDGRLYFGGINGFNVFDPSKIAQQREAAPIIITNFSLLGNQHSHFGLKFDNDSILTLDYKENVINIEFALLDFAAPLRNRFEYWLEGFDANWRAGGTHNFATYTNLDAGEYVFHVRGISANGAVSSNEARLRLVIEPAPWASWWAYTGYALITLVLLFALWRTNVRRIARDHQLDNERGQRRWAETMHQLSQALAASLDARSVASQLADHLGRMVEFNIAALFVEQGTDITLAGSRGLTGNQERKLALLPAQGGHLLAEFRHVRKPVRFDKSYLPVAAFVEETPHIQQYLVVPLISRGGELAILLLGRTEQAFTEQDVEISSAFARQALTALDNARLFSEVQNLGTIDSLTRVHNRRFFFEQAELEFTRSKRYNRDLALLLIDADHFRDINELYGQDIGDRVLKMIANAARDGLRHFDLIGRYSGESFIILLPETRLNVAADVADRLRRSIEELRFETHRGELRVTASIGVAVNHNGEPIPDLASLINKADMGLYEAKRAGRNRVVVAQH